MLINNLNAYTNTTRQNVGAADTSTQVMILEEQLKKRQEFEKQMQHKLEALQAKYQEQTELLKELHELNCELRRDNDTVRQ